VALGSFRFSIKCILRVSHFDEVRNNHNNRIDNSE
jgi:hypothetical protein